MKGFLEMTWLWPLLLVSIFWKQVILNFQLNVNMVIWKKNNEIVMEDLVE